MEINQILTNVILYVQETYPAGLALEVIYLILQFALEYAEMELELVQKPVMTGFRLKTTLSVNLTAQALNRVGTVVAHLEWHPLVQFNAGTLKSFLHLSFVTMEIQMGRPNVNQIAQEMYLDGIV